MATISKRYKGVGKTWVRAYGSNGPWRHPGNVSQLNLKIELETEREPDFTRLGGGTAKRIDIVKQVNADMVWHQIDGDNLALALAADSSAVPAGSVTVAEEHAAFKGGLVRLAHPPSNIDSVASVIGTTTYAAGTDYEISAGGLYIPDGSAIPNAASPGYAANIKVLYDYGAYTQIEAATNALTEIELFFEGLNEAESGKGSLVSLWRMALPPASELALIGAQMARLNFSAELLKDATRTGGDMSQFFTAQYVD